MTHVYTCIRRHGCEWEHTWMIWHQEVEGSTQTSFGALFPQSLESNRGVRIVEEDKPLSYLSMRISKTVKNGKVWYHLDQEDHIYQFLVDQNAMGLKPVSAPMPDRKELVAKLSKTSYKERTCLGQSDSGVVELLCDMYKI